ncbi:unnamed protein product [Ambrosiozyma monospora]|uniref:Unnamed protein product n=1 Tax=Ambrosiozyma monospora TaxID=43982 RepID=A0ACB5SZF0_AMBMO|nr:unnamed protein product [Ambrosiozyma monospora]
MSSIHNNHSHLPMASSEAGGPMQQRPQGSTTGILTTSMLPPPPIFKPTFIQMQRSNGNNGSLSFSTSNLGSANPNSNSNNSASPKVSSNSNYLTSSFIPTEDYNNRLIQHSPSISPMTHYNDPPLPSGSSTPLMAPQNGKPTKKRRRSSSVTNKEELERKKKELKAQHSIIEKKRRIKMNREFEALKYMVPACRLNILGGFNENNFENSNMMHKLTILQSTVEYIKYLHLVIKLLKMQMLNPKETRGYFKRWLNKNDNLKFVDFDLDLQQYRNIDEEFEFDELFMKVWKNDGNVLEADLDPLSKEIMEVLEGTQSASESSEDESEFDDADDDDSSNGNGLNNNIVTPATTASFSSTGGTLQMGPSSRHPSTTHSAAYTNDHSRYVTQINFATTIIDKIQLIFIRASFSKTFPITVPDSTTVGSSTISFHYFFSNRYKLQISIK